MQYEFTLKDLLHITKVLSEHYNDLWNKQLKVSYSCILKATPVYRVDTTLIITRRADNLVRHSRFVLTKPDFVIADLVQYTEHLKDTFPVLAA